MRAGGVNRLLVDSGLVLSLVSNRDAGELFALIEADRERLRVWLPWVDSTRRLGDTLAFIRTSMAAARGGQEFVYGVRQRGRLRGVVALRVNSANRKASLGYWLEKSATGRGLATRACRRLIDHAFGGLGLNRVSVHCALGNKLSRGVPKRLGLRCEGIERQAELVNGRFLDHAVYAVLAADWRRRGR